MTSPECGHGATRRPMPDSVPATATGARARWWSRPTSPTSPATSPAAALPQATDPPFPRGCDTPAVPPAAGPLAKEHIMSDPFVLITGAWHGGWAWRPVAEHLRAAGHAVYTPTLPGLADGDDPAQHSLADTVQA